jgi:hypothetical protein
MERVALARLAPAKLQGWIHAARGMGVAGSMSTELKIHKNIRFQRLPRPVNRMARHPAFFRSRFYLRNFRFCVK